jgi:hypothetical protein
MGKGKKMKKQIALRQFSIENTLKAYFGDCYSYTSPSGNMFFDAGPGVEVCMYGDGRVSLCGMGEYKRVFSGPAEFRSFVKEKMR